MRLPKGHRGGAGETEASSEVRITAVQVSRTEWSLRSHTDGGIHTPGLI